MGSQPYLGDIMMFGGNFAPEGWALCNGQLMSIAQNSALFSILGTTYGGDGMNTFGLPDLRGRLPISFGQGPGLSNYQQGEASGSETVTLTSATIPSHNHALNANNDKGDVASPVNAFSAVVLDSTNALSNGYDGTVNTAMDPTGATGGSQPHNNLQPYLCINFCIALEGIYPSRS